jgi:hypothetical protein
MSDRIEIEIRECGPTFVAFACLPACLHVRLRLPPSKNEGKNPYERTNQPTAKQLSPNTEKIPTPLVKKYR